MARLNLADGYYESQSLNADAQDTLNLYPEIDESGQGKASMYLYSKPGRQVFINLPTNPVRGQIWVASGGSNGRMFAVAGTSFYEIIIPTSPQTTNVQTVANDGNPVSMAYSSKQILIISAGKAYVFDMSTNIWTSGIESNFAGPPIQAEYIDGFFIVLAAAATQFAPTNFYVSNVLDATTWTANGSAIVSVFPENVVTMIASHRELYMLGNKKGVAYASSSNLFPFDVISGSTMETGGSWAAFAASRMDNTIFWLGQDERGSLVAYKLSGYLPLRVSTHAIENKWSKYLFTQDAVSYTYQETGHSFWVITFPSANATWVFDAATNKWHRRGVYNPFTGSQDADLGWNHSNGFGFHLIGDRLSGIIYQQSIQFQTDNGIPISWLRRTPVVNNENLILAYKRFILDCETGMQQTNPAVLRWSDDGGHTWSNGYPKTLGAPGEYRRTVQWYRLGTSRQRIFELSGTGPIRVIDGYIRGPQFKPSKRFAQSIRESA